MTDLISFSIPYGCGEDQFFTFNVEAQAVCFAGCRKLSLDKVITGQLVEAFGKLGFSFMTGCADGVDRSFLKAFGESAFRSRSIMACAFRRRMIYNYGAYPLHVVPVGLPAKAALAKRTLWMTSRCSLLVLFPGDPMGRGSALAFKSAVMNNKPVFIVTDTKPAESELYQLYPSSLFGVVAGFWAIPPVYANTGLCYEVV